MKSKITWKIAIKKVLKEEGRPLHYADIAKYIIEKKYKPTLGITPKKTVYTSLKRMTKKDDEISIIENGIFTYNKNNK